MQYRQLGRTGLDVGIIGLGGEYLEFSPKQTLIEVVHEAIDHGVNYFDLFMASPDARTHYGEALRGKRDSVLVAGHLGSSFIDGQYCRTRDLDVCNIFFEDLLRRLRTDHIDILMLHFVDEPDDFKAVFQRKGILGLAKRLKEEGKVRFLGMSGHKASVAVNAAQNAAIDVLMYPVNPAHDALPANVAWLDGQEAGLSGPDPLRTELYRSCCRNKIGLVAMKPFAGGRLLRHDDAAFDTLSPLQCLHYALSRPGVCTVVPGCRDIAELRRNLAYLQADAKDLDFTGLKSSLLKDTAGSCMYCNHCLPCPSSIDIAQVMRLTDVSMKGNSAALRQSYHDLRANASDCIKCGECMGRCPFGVNVIDRMRRAVKRFGNGHRSGVKVP